MVGTPEQDYQLLQEPATRTYYKMCMILISEKKCFSKSSDQLFYRRESVVFPSNDRCIPCICFIFGLHLVLYLWHCLSPKWNFFNWSWGRYIIIICLLSQTESESESKLLISRASLRLLEYLEYKWFNIHTLIMFQRQCQIRVWIWTVNQQHFLMTYRKSLKYKCRFWH